MRLKQMARRMRPVSELRPNRDNLRKGKQKMERSSEKNATRGKNQGVENSDFHNLKSICYTHSPDVVCLLEMKNKSSPIGLCWDFRVMHLSSKAEIRRDQCAHLVFYLPYVSDQVLLRGDFNLLLSAQQKQGGIPYEWAKVHELKASPVIHLRGITNVVGRIMYKNSWIDLHACMHGADAAEVISSAWNSSVTGSAMFVVHGKIKACRPQLLAWRKRTKSNARLKIMGMEDELKGLKALD
ncbi:conserved hypothetical protein [Ricinus communis]|uniref:Endonuclease/exonuclease/phosphatase domain-containing protein n=1 Tax=Ricinus communis TaxID=3988 RepID=B9SNX3_RICCO|nr:conserved hypothetical protein [Ricinus communis]